MWGEKKSIKQASDTFLEPKPLIILTSREHLLPLYSQNAVPSPEANPSLGLHHIEGVSEPMQISTFRKLVFAYEHQGPSAAFC